jgi:hypothetical protein
VDGRTERKKLIVAFVNFTKASANEVTGIAAAVRISYMATCAYVWVLCASEEEEPLFLDTALTDFFLKPRQSVFSVRYELNICV